MVAWCSLLPRFQGRYQCLGAIGVFPKGLQIPVRDPVACLGSALGGVFSRLQITGGNQFGVRIWACRVELMVKIFPEKSSRTEVRGIIHRHMNDDQELNRLRWQCRRGMLELDLILMQFLEAVYPALEPALQRDFSRLLEYPDPVLQGWLLQHGMDVEVSMQPIVSRVRQGGRDGRST